jgi:hypothetical protein
MTMTRRVGSPGNSPKRQAKLNILRLWRQGKTKQQARLTVHGVNAILVRAGVR